MRGVCTRSVGRYWLQTLGCPKNQVDSDKLEGYLGAAGHVPAADPGAAELVVVNTCAFIEAARQESIDTVLSLAERASPRRPPRRDGLHGRAVRRRAARGPARGRPRRRLRTRPRRTPAGAESSSLWRPGHPAGEGDEPQHQRLRSARAAPAHRHRPVGLREGGRGLRPHLRLLRHPVVPRQAALPRPRERAGRGRRVAWRHRRRRRTAAPRDRPRGPGPRVVRP